MPGGLYERLRSFAKPRRAAGRRSRGHVAAPCAIGLARGGAPAPVNARFRGAVQRAMKLVECWRWRFRDPASGRVCRTMYAITEEEARKFPQAERVPGTLILREVDEVDFVDTLPWVGVPSPK